MYSYNVSVSKNYLSALACEIVIGNKCDMYKINSQYMTSNWNKSQGCWAMYCHGKRANVISWSLFYVKLKWNSVKEHNIRTQQDLYSYIILKKSQQLLVLIFTFIIFYSVYIFVII